jgi:PAS domain S-box-containing protein
MPKRLQTSQVETPGADPRAAERRVREIIDGLRDAFLGLDAGGCVIECNARAESILGRRRAELLGRSIWDLIGVPPDSPLGQAALRVRETGEPEDSEFTLKLNGVERLLQMRGFRLGEGLGVLATDATEARSAERRLAESEARFREAAAPAWITRADGTLEHLNAALCQLVGRTEAEILEGGIERHVHPDDLAGLQEARLKARTTHSPFLWAAKVRRADGAWRTLQLSGHPRYDAQGAFRGHVGTAVDITDELAAQRRQELLIKELNHRVRNTLATVQAIVRQTLKESPAARETFEVLKERLLALAAVHETLTRESWEEAELSEIARQAVAAFDPDSRITIAGPAVKLDPGAALSLFMAINELATNALRHGALSTPDGRVILNWARRDGAVELEWRESGGPPVVPPARTGFGTRLLADGLRAELGAPAEITHAPDGLICRIRARMAGGAST